MICGKLSKQDKNAQWIKLCSTSPVYTTKKLPRVNPGSTWVELTHVDFCSVNAYLPGLNPDKLNPPPEVG